MSNQIAVIANNSNLKIAYEGMLQDQFNNDCSIYKGASTGQFPYTGLNVVRALNARRNQGIGAGADNGLLPNKGKSIPVQATINCKFNWLRIGLSAPVMKASQSDKGAFMRELAYQMRFGYDALQSDVNRQMSWDGSGTLCQMSSAAVATTSITISGRESGEPALQFVDIGGTYDIYTSAGALVQSSVTINAITSGTANSDTAVLTMDVPVTASAGDVFVRAGSYGYEVQGLLTQINNGTSTVFGLDRASYQILQSNEVDLNGAQLSLAALKEAHSQAQRRGGKGINAVFSDFDSRDYYEKLLVADKRYPNTVKGDGTFSNKDTSYLEYAGMPWVADKDCPKRVFFLNSKVIEKYPLAMFEWANETGSQLIADSEVDGFEARLRVWFNLFNAQASGCAVVKDYVSP